MIGCEMFAIRTQMETDTFYGYDPQGLTFNTTMNFKDLVTTGVTGFSPSAGRQKLSYNPQHGDAEDRYFSTFFTGNVSYADRYVLFGSVRYDKTNLYGRSGKYRDQPTWSIGGKWNVSSESFFEVGVIRISWIADDRIFIENDVICNVYLRIPASSFHRILPFL